MSKTNTKVGFYPVETIIEIEMYAYCDTQRQRLMNEFTYAPAQKSN